MTAPRPEPALRLAREEREDLLALSIPIRLATIDHDGYPRVTPLWFIRDLGVFYMTSVPGSRHLLNLGRDRRASVCIDTEGPPGPDGVRPNQQIKARGLAELFDDRDGEWTRRITLKYIPGAEGERRASHRAAMPRVVIRLAPERLFAIGVQAHRLQSSQPPT